MVDEQSRRPRGRQRATPPGAVHPAELIGVRVNHRHDRVMPRLIRRIFRNHQGDWCAEIAGDEQSPILVFDHHPTISVLNMLKSAGVDITDEIINHGAEGLDMRELARLTEDQ
jgi:hypothetical protein